MTRILLVEDDENTREGLAEILTGEGFGVDSFACAEAIPARTGQQIDVLLTDLRLPGKSGIEIVREIKNNGQDVFCIIMTAFSTPECYLEGKRLGVNAWLSKPLNIDKLLSLLQKFNSVPIYDEGHDVTSDEFQI